MILLLVVKILREQRWTLILSSLLLGLFFVLGTYLYTTFGQLSVQAMSQFSPEILSGLFGGLLGTVDPLETWLITLFVHPLVLTLYSVVAVAVTARTLAGEIDRGTIDILLSCPVARWQLVSACGIVLVAAHALMTAVVWGGLHLGLLIGGIDPPGSMAAFRWVALNLYGLFLAAGGVCLLISASNSEQGRAVGRSLGFLVLSFFVNLIASLWDRVAWMDTFSIFHYHQPQPVVDGTADLGLRFGVLLGLAGLCLLAALIVFARRDITTV